jgi:hypothetical protein
MPKRLRLPRLMRDLRDEVNVEKLIREHRGIDIGAPVSPDTRLSGLVGAISIPVVRLVASDHIKVAKPNRAESSAVMKHHRVNS